MPTSSSATPLIEERAPDLLRDHGRRLSFWERFSIRWIRRGLSPGLLGRFLWWCQRTVGQAWIHYATRHLLHLHGLEHFPTLAKGEGVLLVANHRSFFDLYVVAAHLVRSGLPRRIVFPVRANFFYDSPLGLIVNFWMSFWSMYPPIFREKKKAPANLSSLDELGELLERGGVLVGLHPEGTRGKGPNPYELLPAQPGVGRVIHRTRVSVVPVFILGLENDLFRQVTGNFTGRGTPIHVVMGAPIDFTDLRAEKASPRVFREMAERCTAVITELGREEQRLRKR